MISSQKKLPTPVFGAPYYWPFWQKKDCQSANNRPILNHNFLYKIQIKWSLFYEKYWQLMYFGPHNAGCFKQIGVSTNSPKIDHFKFYNNFLHKIKIQKGVYFMKKLTSSVFRAPWGRLFWLSSSPPSGQIWDDQFFLMISNIKSKFFWGLLMQKFAVDQNWHSWPTAISKN